MNSAAGSVFGNFGGSTTSTPGGFNSQPNPPQRPQDDASRWFKLATKGCGILAGLLSLALGMFACITFHASCLAAGLIQMFLGFLLIAFEAPCCCMFLDFIERISTFSETRPHWQKALLYVVTSLIPIILCFEVSTFFGSGLIFVTGVMYAMMALGKKADRSEMLARAAGSNPPPNTTGPGNTAGGFFNFGFGQSGSVQTNIGNPKQPPVLTA